MKRTLTNTILGSALALFAFAAPGFGSEIISFSNSSGQAGGTFVSASTSGAAVTALTNIKFDTITFSGDLGLSSVTVGNGGFLLNMSGSTLTLTTVNALALSNGTLAAGSILSQISLLTPEGACSPNTVVLCNNELANGLNTNGIVFPTATSVGGMAAFLTDESSYLTTPVTLSGMTVTSANSHSGTTWTATSETLSFTANVSTPEPVSFLLMGTGFLAIAFVARRKLAPVAGR